MPTINFPSMQRSSLSFGSTSKYFLHNIKMKHILAEQRSTVHESVIPLIIERKSYCQRYVDYAKRIGNSFFFTQLENNKDFIEWKQHLSKISKNYNFYPIFDQCYFWQSIKDNRKFKSWISINSNC